MNLHEPKISQVYLTIGQVTNMRLAFFPYSPKRVKLLGQSTFLVIDFDLVGNYHSPGEIIHHQSTFKLHTNDQSQSICKLVTSAKLFTTRL